MDLLTEVMLEPQPNKPRCHIPWQQMVIDATGAVSPCSFWSGFGNNNGLIGNVNQNSISEIWNGEKFQLLRKYMAEGNLEKSGCSKCFAIKNKLDLDFEYDPESDNDPESVYSQNIKLLKGEVRQKKEILESPPTIVSFTPTHACNFRCTHCYQQDTRSSKMERPQVYQEVQNLTPTLVQVIAGGGEPFIQPFWKEFISEFHIEKNKYLKFGTATNASMMTEKIMNGLAHFKSLNINISFDGGSKEVFEKVRVHGNYDEVIANIQKIKNLVGSKKNSTTGICLSVMKSNMDDLDQFIKLCSRLKVPFSFSPVTVMPPDESICSFNDIAQETRSWKESLEKAREAMRTDFFRDYLNSTPELLKTWIHYIDVIEAEVPWHFLEQTHSRFKISIKRSFLESFKSFYEKYQPMLYLYKKGASWRGSNQYYTYLENQEGSVSLPSGKFNFSISSKWKNVELDHNLFFRIYRFSLLNISLVTSHPALKFESTGQGHRVINVISLEYIFWKLTKPFAKAVLGDLYAKFSKVYRRKTS